MMTLAFILRPTIKTSAVVGVGGCVFYFFKGARRNASDVVAGAKEVMDNASQIRRCTAWSGIMTAMDIGMQHLRHRAQDPLNLMVAWGAANALFSAHRGPRAAVREGLKGAAVGGAVSIFVFTLRRLVYSGKRCCA